MAKKKAKLGTMGLVVLITGFVGAVLSVIGLFVAWFASSVTVLGETIVDFYRLFGKLKIISVDALPIELVQAFGIIAAVAAVVAFAVMLCRCFKFISISGFAKLIVSVLTIIFGVLALVFTIAFVGSLGGLDVGDFGSISYAPAFGAFFTGIGCIVSGATLLLNK